MILLIMKLPTDTDAQEDYEGLRQIPSLLCHSPAENVNSCVCLEEKGRMLWVLADTVKLGLQFSTV